MRINEIKEGKVKIQGWIENLRDKKNMQFVVIRDITGKIQVTVVKSEKPEVAEIFSHATLESTVIITGEAVKNEFVKLGGIEIIPDEVEITSKAEALPIGEETSIDQRIDYRWIDLRTEKNALLFQVQTLITQCFREFCCERGFVEIHSPKIIGAESESGSGVFEVKYFEGKAYLSQSPQFYKQMAIASGFEKVFECGPVFRAEKFSTNRHATEFTGFDFEFQIEKFEDVMNFEEDIIIYTLSKIKNKMGEKIKEVFGTDVIVPVKPFPRISLDNLYEEIAKYGHERTQDDMFDMSTEAEKLAYKFSKEKYGHEFVFIVDFPKQKRAFYHMREGEKLLGYDLIWKGIEITTGAQRENRYELLKKQAEEKGLEKDVEFYLNFFKYGCPRHGGFGFGLERVTMCLLENLSIKETQFIYRGRNRISP